MAECAYCKALTELCDCGVPVCAKCADSRAGRQELQISEREVLNLLEKAYQAATQRGQTAIQAFDVITRDIPSRIPHPDGKQRINNASREVSLARTDLMRAHKRLDDFLTRGIVPKDLKKEKGT